MKIACLGDRHISSRSPRYAHALACWDFAISDAIAQGATHFVGLGDVCEGTPSGEEQYEIGTRYRRMVAVGPTIEVLGNHEEYQALRVHELLGIQLAWNKVRLKEFGECVIVGIPYPRRGKAPFDRLPETPTIGEGLTSAGQAITAAVATARKLYPHHRLLVAGHWTVAGQTVGIGDYELHSAHETIVPIEGLAPADLVVTGHVHRAQAIANVVGAGSLYRCSFTEKADAKSYVLVTIESEGLADPRLTWERRPIPARAMAELTVAWPLSAIDQAALDGLTAQASGAEIKVVVTVPEDQARTYDPSVFFALQAAATWTKIERRIQPTQRTRAPGLTQSTSLAEQLMTWAHATGQTVEPERSARLTGKLAEIET